VANFPPDLIFVRIPANRGKICQRRGGQNGGHQKKEGWMAEALARERVREAFRQAPAATVPIAVGVRR